MEITDAWLMEMGGWQEMKRARALHAAGAVLQTEFDGTRLSGLVRDTGKDLATGLHIRSRSDMDNLCTCFQSRRHGTLCAHALAAGTAWVHRHEKQPARQGSPGSSSTSSPDSPARTAPPAQPASAPGPLQFLLPASFPMALQRRKLGISVLPAPPHEDPAPDLPLLLWLGSLQQKSVPPHLALSGTPQIDAALKALAAHPRIQVQEGAIKFPLSISPDPARFPLSITTAGLGNVRLNLHLPHPAAQAILPTSPDDSGWLWNPSSHSLAPLTVPSPFFEILKTLPPARPLDKSRRWLAANLVDLQNHFEIDTTHSDPEALRFLILPGPPQFQLSLDGNLEKLTARLRVHYPGGPAPFPPGTPDIPGFPLETPDDPHVFRSRNLPAESAAASRLAACGFQPGASPAADWTLNRENAILQFFAGELPKLEALWQVTHGTRFAAATKNVERLSPRWSPTTNAPPSPAKSGIPNDWLSFNLDFTSNQGTSLDRLEIARLLATGTGHKKLPNGRIAVVSLAGAMDLNEVLRDVSPQQEGGGFRVQRHQLGYLENTFGSPLEKTAPPAWPMESMVPVDLQSILRDYQKTGVQWLLDRSASGHGGILADEMGLGKTLQSLSLLAALRGPWPDRPALVVCPKSLTANWRAEAARFTPQLNCVVLEGPHRKNQLANLSAAHLVITSYQLLARDLPHHQKIGWGAVILDEAGFIRNPDTQAAKAARALKARVRFALTGTPIENGIRDLWSLMDFALPGYLGPRKEFSERYELPLSSGSQPALMNRLRRRMAPWILRRLKQDVAKDLPSKIEKIHPCALTPVQQDLYTSLMREGAAKVIDAENAKQQGQARMHLLTTLLRLRQTCCDPRLLKLNLPSATPEELSGKMEALAGLLEEIRDGGHSVIIFSAFASLLRLISETVTAADLGYCLLDGQTQDRHAQVQSFQNDPAKRVFLISLKAGGYGLNLTKADTVIHFDPWWNPAVEAQATDRAHRIGQEKPVTVYKLITTGTIEEKILRLQEKKRGLMDAALDDQNPLMDGLTDDDLRALVLT